MAVHCRWRLALLAAENVHLRDLFRDTAARPVAVCCCEADGLRQSARLIRRMRRLIHLSADMLNKPYPYRYSHMADIGCEIPIQLEDQEPSP